MEEKIEWHFLDFTDNKDTVEMIEGDGTKASKSIIGFLNAQVGSPLVEVVVVVLSGDDDDDGGGGGGGDDGR